MDMQQYVNNVTQILVDLAGKNNATAEIRQKELYLLQDMLKEVTRREGLQSDPEALLTPAMSHGVGNIAPCDSLNEWAGRMEDISLSHTQILTLAQQLEGSGTDLDIYFGFGNNDSWIQ